MNTQHGPEEVQDRGRYRLWLLTLVPNVKHGRWWCGTGLLAVLLAVFGAAGTFAVGGENPPWPAALFFCATLAYVAPMFHYITRRTEEAFDELVPSLDIAAAEAAKLRRKISAKPAPWLTVNTLGGVIAWLLQSRLLAGSLENMGRSITGTPTEMVMAVGPLFVWLFLTCAVHALVDNARLFRKLTALVQIDLLDTRRLNPFGRMAVSSTLMVIGAMALFPIMWLGPSTDIWTTVPGLIPTTAALVFLFLAPIWPIHQALRGIKRSELDRVQGEINAIRGNGGSVQDYVRLTPLLAYRREIASTPEWPFDLSIVARFGLYLIIVPLTWIGAALIENLVDIFID